MTKKEELTNNQVPGGFKKGRGKRKQMFDEL
jgi:hypothetical protein